MVFFSTIDHVYYFLPLLGLVVGLFGAMLGGGGGFFFMPILTVAFKMPAQSAVITALVATLPICAVGSFGHYRKGNINVKAGLYFSIIGIVGAFLGTTITTAITTSQFHVAFGVYAILIALNMILTTRHETSRNTLKKHPQKSLLPLSRKAKSGFFALSAGIITGTFGTSGTAPVLAGLFNLRIPVKVVIGTSLMVVLTNTIFAIGAHSVVGRIDMEWVGLLTSGSVIGAFIGTKLLAKSKIEKSEGSVKYGYAVIMVLLGIFMITRK